MYTKKSPYEVPTKIGETVYICACGKTKNAPFRDNSHATQNTGLTPLAHTADKDGRSGSAVAAKHRTARFATVRIWADLKHTQSAQANHGDPV